MAKDWKGDFVELDGDVFDVFESESGSEDSQNAVGKVMYTFSSRLYDVFWMARVIAGERGGLKLGVPHFNAPRGIVTTTSSNSQL